MQRSGFLKKIVFVDLLIGLTITAVAWVNLGTEGMAARFCNLVHVETCDEIEWSEEYSELLDDQE